MANKGYIKLSRTFFENDLWKKARTYNDSEAWLDLIQSARFEASEITSRVGGRDITWSRGQYPASIRFLAERWKWSERKVRSFLCVLKKNKMIKSECSSGMNIITLLNFSKYNDSQSDTVSDTDKKFTVSELYELLTHNRHSVSDSSDTANDTDNTLSNNVLNVKLTQQMTQTRHKPDTKNKKDKNILKEDSTYVESKKNDDGYNPFEILEKVKEAVLSESFSNSRNMLCMSSKIKSHEFGIYANLIFEDWNARLLDNKPCDIDITHFRYQFPTTVAISQKQQKQIQGGGIQTKQEWRESMMQSSYEAVNTALNNEIT